MKLLVALVLALALTACGSGAGTADSGIRGRALIGPACPVEPCDAPNQPFHGSFLVRQDGTVVATVQTDSLGRFSKRLEPGRYVLESKDGLPLLKPQPVTVRPGAYADLELTFDSGIRGATR